MVPPEKRLNVRDYGNLACFSVRSGVNHSHSPFILPIFKCHSAVNDAVCSFQGPVYFYYYLENFFQNHRRYVKSRNDQQYLGKLDVSTIE